MGFLPRLPQQFTRYSSATSLSCVGNPDSLHLPTKPLQYNFCRQGQITASQQLSPSLWNLALVPFHRGLQICGCTACHPNPWRAQLPRPPLCLPPDHTETYVLQSGQAQASPLPLSEPVSVLLGAPPHPSQLLRYFGASASPFPNLL